MKPNTSYTRLGYTNYQKSKDNSPFGSKIPGIKNVSAIVMPFCLSDNRRLLSYFNKLKVDYHDIPFKFTRYYKSTTTNEMMIDIKAFYINT
jgi:hypothetical protein